MNSPLPIQIQSWEDYQRVYSWSLERNDDFWASVATEYVTWRRPWEKVSSCDYQNAKVEWFSGARLNVAENCLDRHVSAGIGNKPALIWIGNAPGEEKTYSFQELTQEVCRVAEALRSIGIQKGDRVAIYLPNIPQLAMSVLACARLGIIHTVIFGGFSASAIHSRVQDCGAKLIITANGAYRGKKWIDLKKTVDEAMDMGCPTVEKVVVFERHPESRVPHRIERRSYDLPWDAWLNQGTSEQTRNAPDSHDSEDPLFILYTSGSTGKPKGVLHTMGGYLTHVAYTHDLVFQSKRGSLSNEVYWCTADVGWITGHSYLIYGPLANGVTTLMFEGIPTYPDPGRFWEIVERHQVRVFYSAPTAIRVLAAAGNEYVNRYNRDSLRVLGTVGEPINPEAWHWYSKTVGQNRCPIVDTWWQTETGGILLSPIAGITPTKPGSASLPIPGIEPKILASDLENQTAAGPLVMARSWPGQMRGVYADPQRFHQTYFIQYPGYYFTGDGARTDEDGLYWVTGRIDDVIKVSGHRLGTAEIESACAMHEWVMEAATIGVPDPITGEAIELFVVLRDGCELPHQQLRSEIIEAVRKGVGPLASPKKIYWTKALPKTRSGKIMRRLLKKIGAGETTQLGDLTTLADPSVVETLIQSVQQSVSESEFKS